MNMVFRRTQVNILKYKFILMHIVLEYKIYKLIFVKEYNDRAIIAVIKPDKNDIIITKTRRIYGIIREYKQ